MITLKDLRKVYDGRMCIRFEYDVLLDNQCITASFKKIDKSIQNEWKMQIVMPRTRDKDSEVYTFGYVMPRSNLPLELIAATGLRYLQLYIKEEIQQKSNLDFILGEITKDM